MTTSPASERFHASAVWFERGKIFLQLGDGREVGVPLALYPRLAHASVEELMDWEMDDEGTAIHWPRLDEDLSVEGLAEGRRPLAPSQKVVKDLAPKVLAARRMSGLTQKELAERLGYSQTYVSLAERGMTPFGAYYVDQVLQACGAVKPQTGN